MKGKIPAFDVALCLCLEEIVSGENMDLSIKRRSFKTKGEVKETRREGNIPAVMYSQGEKGESIEVDGAGYAAACRKLKPGHLPNTVFSLKDQEGKTTRAIVKEIQYHPSTYRVLHMDFVELKDKVPLNIKIPIRYVGAADCPGVKLGGVLREVIRHVPVRCLPKDIPNEFSIDVSHMAMSQSCRLNAIKLPANVKARCSMNEVAAVIAKR